ncbi:MAG: hypothetical protein JO075_13345, partial [Acidimicrobiia bacterium]|nr:hypothetical protein [Acidimicrobiia bacterium]
MTTLLDSSAPVTIMLRASWAFDGASSTLIANPTVVLAGGRIAALVAG